MVYFVVAESISIDEMKRIKSTWITARKCMPAYGPLGHFLSFQPQTMKRWFEYKKDIHVIQT